jgi:hypothetical protein
MTPVRSPNCSSTERTARTLNLSILNRSSDYHFPFAEPRSFFQKAGTSASEISKRTVICCSLGRNEKILCS